MTESNCQIQLEDSAKEGSTITVGQIFALQCDGDWAQFNWQNAQFQLSPEDNYKIKYLEGQKTDKGAVIKVTSYKTGEHQLPLLTLISGVDERKLSGVKFKTESVISQTEPVSEPFGPRGPLGLSYPWWYYGIWIFLGLAVLAVVFHRFRRWQQKQKLIRELEEQGSAVEPFAQFSQTLRRLQRNSHFLLEKTEAEEAAKLEFFSELEKAYRTYLGRTFLIPTFAWKDPTILRALRRADREVFQAEGEVVTELLREFAQAKENFSKVKNQDLQQIFELSRTNVDKIFVLRKNRTAGERNLQKPVQSSRSKK